MFNALPYDFRCRQGRYLLLIGTILFTSLLMGCDSGTAPSIYDPNRASLPDPIIEDVSPESRALAGVDEVIIMGQNFSTQASENLVYFGADRAEVVEASSTQLRMVAPNSPQPELELRLVVIGAENFSNSISYSLEPPFVEFGEVKDFEDVFGIATDLTGNVYISTAAFGIPVGIVQISHEGERSEYISSPFLWTDITFGPNNDLYGVRSVRAIFRHQEGSDDFEVYAVIPDNTVRLTSIAVSENGHVWAVGNNKSIYSISPDRTVRDHTFEADVKDVTLFDNYLYIAAVQNDDSKIWRLKIGSNGVLGDPEEFFDMTTFNGATAFSMIFSASGDLYIGTNATDPVVVVTPDGVGQPLYPGVLNQPARRFAWGRQRQLYATTNATESVDASIIRITTRD